MPASSPACRQVCTRMSSPSRQRAIPFPFAGVALALAFAVHASAAPAQLSHSRNYLGVGAGLSFDRSAFSVRSGMGSAPAAWLGGRWASMPRRKSGSGSNTSALPSESLARVVASGLFHVFCRRPSGSRSQRLTWTWWPAAHSGTLYRTC